MHVIIVGCGRIGAELAYRLYKQGIKVAVVDQDAAAFDNLPPDFRGRMHEGDAMNQQVLLRAGIEEAEAVACVTNSDALNAVVGHVAKTVYHVPKVVVRNYDSRLRHIYDLFHLQVISSSIWGAQRLDEMITKTPARTIFSAGNGEVEIYEITVTEAVAGKRIGELNVPGKSLVVSLTRDGRAVLPAEDESLVLGDMLCVSATPEGITRIQRMLESK